MLVDIRNYYDDRVFDLEFGSNYSLSTLDYKNVFIDTATLYIDYNFNIYLKKMDDTRNQNFVVPIKYKLILMLYLISLLTIIFSIHNLYTNVLKKSANISPVLFLGFIGAIYVTFINKLFSQNIYTLECYIYIPKHKLKKKFFFLPATDRKNQKEVKTKKD